MRGSLTGQENVDASGAEAASRENAKAPLRLIVAEAVKARAAAENLASLPEGMSARIIDMAIGSLAAQPGDGSAGVTMSSALLVSAVAESFSRSLSLLSAQQQQALRYGLDPFNPAVLAALELPGGLARLMSGWRPDEVTAAARSGHRFADLREDGSRVAGRAAYSGLGLSDETIAGLVESGLSRSTFDSLKGQYGAAEIASAAGFASANLFTGKFIRLDGEDRSELREHHARSGRAQRRTAQAADRGIPQTASRYRTRPLRRGPVEDHREWQSQSRTE